MGYKKGVWDAYKLHPIMIRTHTHSYINDLFHAVYLSYILFYISTCIIQVCVLYILVYIIYLCIFVAIE